MDIPLWEWYLDTVVRKLFEYLIVKFALEDDRLLDIRGGPYHKFEVEGIITILDKPKIRGRGLKDSGMLLRNTKDNLLDPRGIFFVCHPHRIMETHTSVVVRPVGHISIDKLIVGHDYGDIIIGYNGCRSHRYFHDITRNPTDLYAVTHLDRSLKKNDDT